MNDSKLHFRQTTLFPLLALLFASGIGVVLSGLRIARTHNGHYALLPGNLFLCIVLEHARSAPPHQVAVEGGVIEQAASSIGKRAGVSLLEDQAGVADNVRYLSAIGADHRRLAGHGLGQCPAKLLFPVGARERR